MALRTSFTRVFGAVIPSAWANSIRDHLVTIATSNDVTSEGQLCVNTNADRLMVHDGTAAHRLAHYSQGGRTGASGTVTAVAIGAGTTAQIGFSSLTDPDGFYTGWNGTVNAFTVPAGLGGVYAISVNVFSSVSLTAGGVSVSITTGGLTYPCSSAPPTNYGAVSVSSVPIPAGGIFSVAVRNEHSALSNFDVRIFAYRVFA